MSRLHPARRIALAGAALALTAGAASAQAAPDTAAQNARAARRGFTDSWYWGVKGGTQQFATNIEAAQYRPLVGVDWLITKRRGALLVSAEQAFFERSTAVWQPDSEDARLLALQDARRYSVAALAFPLEWRGLRPYGGIGLALDVMRKVTPVGDFDSMTQWRAVEAQIDDGSSKASLLAVAGAQYQVGRFAFFAQASGSPAQTRTLWSRGGSTQFEGGIRVNLAASQEP